VKFPLLLPAAPKHLFLIVISISYHTVKACLLPKTLTKKQAGGCDNAPLVPQTQRLAQVFGCGSIPTPKVLPYLATLPQSIAEISNNQHKSDHVTCYESA